MFNSIDEIKEKNKAHGHHFFDHSTMLFFLSLVYSEIYAGRYFITAETGPDEVQRFTIREAKDNGQVVSHSDFQQYASLEDAKEVAREL